MTWSGLPPTLARSGRISTAADAGTRQSNWVVSRDRALRALADGVPACPHCRPDVG
ncbi:DUF6233 domain-containing protein [Streptomyces sp. NPDC040750]|uniref:DUF6233 domain-containing protein n=1 Tax=Streptomyces sp. NPDC040750 TaxID=3154491 RepID=UPI0033CD261A